MYLKPGNLFKDFTVEKKVSGSITVGRVPKNYESIGTIKGALSKASPSETEKYKQLSHPISHTIVQRGKSKAEAESRFVMDKRMFYIQGVDDAGGLGLWTVYYVEEREE